MGIGDTVWFLHDNSIVSALIVLITQTDYAEYDYDTKTLGSTVVLVGMDLIGSDNTIYHINDVSAKEIYTTREALVSALSA